MKTKTRNRLESALDAAQDNNNGNKPQVVERVSIAPVRIQAAEFKIIGTSPLMQLRFSEKSLKQIQDTQTEGKSAGSKRNRKPKDFEDNFRNAYYKDSEKGWPGFNATAIRHGMIAVCRLVDFKMTLAKLSVFVAADGWDNRVGMVPLVRIHGTPEIDVSPVRNATGVIDLRARAIFKQWYANVRLQWDGDQFTRGDITNLMTRVGIQNGIGEGRWNSKMSPGMGFGCFRLAEDGE